MHRLYTSNGLMQCAEWVAFGRDKKYRVCVSIKGKRITRVVDNLTIARETEAAIKGHGTGRRNRPQRRLIPTLANYRPSISWAKEHKKTWDDDMFSTETLRTRGKKRLVPAS
jgi:hypothetical protein